MYYCAMYHVSLHLYISSSRRRGLTSLTVPHFFVEDFVGGVDGGGVDRDECEGYVPASFRDFELGNIVNSVSDLCEV